MLYKYSHAYDVHGFLFGIINMLNKALNILKRNFIPKLLYLNKKKVPGV
jgi:hypothetical protein